MKFKEIEIGTLDLSVIDGDRGKNYPHSNELLEDGYCLFLSANNVTKNGFVFNNNVYISKEKDEVLRKGKLLRNDIVITTRGTVGNVGLYDDSVKFERIRINSGMLIIRCGPSVDSIFLYHVLKSKQFYEQILSIQTGSAQPQLPKSHFLKMFVPNIPLPTQKQISSVLGTIDNKIATNTAINKNLEAQARAIFHDWRNNPDNIKSLSPLSEIANFNTDSYSCKENWEYVNYLDTSNITSGVVGDIQYIEIGKEKLPSRAKRKVKAGDIVYSTVRPNQNHYGIITAPLPNMLVSTGFTVIRSHVDEVKNELIYLCLTESEFTEKMQQIAEQSTSAFPSIRPSDLGSCLIPVPTYEDHAKLATIKSLLDLIVANRAENELLSETRDILIPRLMSGEIDVSNIEI